MPPGLGGELILPASEYARDRRPWLKARRAGLGASETACILGLNQWSTPYAIWTEKVRDDDATDDSPSEAARWGTVLEAPIAREVGNRWPELGKIAPSPGLLRHPEHPWMLATLDRVLVERGRRRGARARSILECKTVGDWMYREHWPDGMPPLNYQVQVVQQLAVTGMDHGYLAALIGGQHLPEPWLIGRDDRVVEQIVEYAGTWWADHVVAGSAPAMTFADRTILTSVYPGDLDLDALRASDNLVDVYAKFLDARRREAEAKAEKEQLAFKVQTAMGDRTALAAPDGTVLATWKPTKTTRIDVGHLRKHFPDTAAECATTTTSRRFLPKTA